MSLYICGVMMYYVRSFTRYALALSFPEAPGAGKIHACLSVRCLVERLSGSQRKLFTKRMPMYNIIVMTLCLLAYMCASRTTYWLLDPALEIVVERISKPRALIHIREACARTRPVEQS